MLLTFKLKILLLWWWGGGLASPPHPHCPTFSLALTHDVNGTYMKRSEDVQGVF